MNKIASAILQKYLREGVRIKDLEEEFWESRIVIYKSELPAINELPIQFIDATPDKYYPLRILRAYRQICNCKWTDTTDGGEPSNLLLKVMNADCDKRAKLLDKAIYVLQQHPYEEKYDVQRIT